MNWTAFAIGMLVGCVVVLAVIALVLRRARAGRTQISRCETCGLERRTTVRGGEILSRRYLHADGFNEPGVSCRLRQGHDWKWVSGPQEVNTSVFSR